MTNIQNQIVEHHIRARNKIGSLSGVSTFIKTERLQRFESDIPNLNAVFSYQRSEAKEPVEEIKEIASSYHERGHKVTWFTYSHEPDKIIVQALTANKFISLSSMTGMALSLENWSSDWDIPDFETRAIRSPKELERFTKVLLAGFDIPEQMSDTFCKIYIDGPHQDHETMQHYLAYVDGEPVTALTTFTEHGVTGIYSVTTSEAHRSKGFAMTALTYVLRDLQKKGTQLAVILAAPTGKGVYSKVGFKEVMTINIFEG